MPLDPSQDPAVAPLVSRPRGAPAAVLLAGVAGACVLGLGLGMWARPSDVERDLTPRRAAPSAQPPTQRRLEIRVHGGTAPATPGPAAAAFAPTPPDQPAPEVAPTPTPPAEPLAPTRAPEGLVRVHAVAPARLADAPGPRPTGLRSPASASAATVSPPKPAAKPAQPEPHPRAEASRRKEAAKAKARAKAEAETARERAEKHAKAEAKAEKAKAEKAKAEARRAQRARAVEAEARKSLHVAASPRAHPPAAHGEGPRRVASASERCASSDPGAALVCADPSLGAADRQLTRAYRDAQAAGVPPAQLQRQQQRWLAARANAAREAPWAVHDVYLARIAELQDQTRQAMRGD